MSNEVSTLATPRAIAGDGVERPALGKAPTAFRLFRANANATDFPGPVHNFTPESAAAVMAEYAARANKRIQIDLNHLSHDSKAPLENQRAVGWHEIETRDTSTGKELWAVRVTWDPEIKAGLEQDPPAWRYLSCAYSIDRKTGEILSYSDVGLTNSPAGHAVADLAAEKIAASAIQRIAASRARFTREATPMQRTDLATVRATFRGVSDAVDSPGFLESLTALPLDRIEAIRATFEDDYSKMVNRGRRAPRATHATGNGGSALAAGDYTPEQARVICAARGIPETPRLPVLSTPTERRAVARAAGWLPR